MESTKEKSVQPHTVKNAIKEGYDLIGKYLPSNYKVMIKEKHPKVNIDVLIKVRHKNLSAENNIKEFTYLVELSKSQKEDLDYLEEIIKK